MMVWTHVQLVLLMCVGVSSSVGKIVCPADKVVKGEDSWYAQMAKQHGVTTPEANGWSFDKALLAYETAPLAGILRGGSVIDVGCGNAQYLKMLSEMHGIATMVGVDPELAFVRAARTVLPTATLCQAGADDLSFIPDDSFDAYISIFPNIHLDDTTLETAMREALRVTKPGGHLLIGCAEAVAPPWGYHNVHPKEWWLTLANKLSIMPPFFKESHDVRGWSHRFDVHFTNLPLIDKEETAFNKTVDYRSTGNRLELACKALYDPMGEGLQASQTFRRLLVVVPLAMAGGFVLLRAASLSFRRCARSNGVSRAVVVAVHLAVCGGLICAIRLG
jgi:SAM-dependent methyltransferase